MTFIAGNVGPHPRYGSASIISARPGGLMTVSTWIGMAAYLVGRFLTIYTNKYRYIFWALVLATITAARMALLTIVLTETVLLIYLYVKQVESIQWRRFILFGLLSGFITLGIATQHPYLSRFISALFSGDFIETVLSSKSIQHRIQSYTYLAQRPTSLFIGGLVLSEVPFAFDSEFVMRTLQFGFLGYIMFKLPMLVLFVRGLRFKDSEMIQLGIVVSIVAFFSSLTMTTSSNMTFIVIFSTLIAFGELIHNE
jgi:hypothetical protein